MKNIDLFHDIHDIFFRCPCKCFVVLYQVLDVLFVCMCPCGYCFVKMISSVPSEPQEVITPVGHNLNKYLVFCILTKPVDKDNTMPNHMLDIQINIIQFTVLFQPAPDIPTLCYKKKL